MLLKSLELFGFKSFADRTALDFDRGVTSVVGPNGCGKSNVLDSIRWVLGEQSAKALRGGEMADVIFNGSEQRKPMGMAEVTLSFTDCEEALGTEWKEVAVTRRVYRDGKSEYLLNGTTCRLRDINELFMDTGIGRSSYSIMEQGKIDLILSSRPEDRRAVFEEAAGITKFKSQKREALRKLEHVEANLVRLDDLMKEVRRQLNSLKRQAGKARRYRELSDALRVVDCAVSKRKLDVLDAEGAEAESEASRLSGELERQSEGILEDEAKLNQAREQQRQMDARLGELRQELTEQKGAISTKESRISFNRERLEEFGQLMERYTSDRLSAEARIGSQEEEIKGLQEELRKAQAELDEARRTVEGHLESTNEVRNRRASLDEQLREKQRLLSRTESQIESITSELNRGQDHRSSSENRLKHLETERGQLEKGLSEFQAELAEVEQELAAAEETEQRLIEQTGEAEEKLNEAKRQLRQRETEVAQVQREVSDVASRAEALRHLVESGEGFGRATQALVEGQGALTSLWQGAARTVAAIVKAEDGFAAAIEAALRGNLQAVLLGKGAELRHVVQALAEEGVGSAALALPEMVPPTGGWQREMTPDGAIAWAMDKVTVIEPGGEELVTALLNGVVIVPDLDTAIDLRRGEPQLTIATVAGEVLLPSGVICTSAQKSDEAESAGGGILARRNELDELTGRLTGLRERLTAAQGQAEEALEAQGQAEEALLSKRNELAEARHGVTDLRNRQGHLQRQITDQNRRLQRITWEEEEINTAEEQAVQAMGEQELERKHQEQVLEKTRLELGRLEEDLVSVRAEETAANERHNELRVRVATGEQTVRNLQQQAAASEQRRTELGEIIRERVRDIADYETRRATHSKESEGLSQEIEGIKSKLLELEGRREEMEAERARVTQAVVEQETNVNRQRNRIVSLQEKAGKLEVKATQIGLKVDNLTQQISERYQVDLREADIDEEQLRQVLADQAKLLREAEAGAEEEAETETPADSEAAAGGGESAEPAMEPEPAEIVSGEIPAELPETTPDEEESPLDWKALEKLIQLLRRKIDNLGPVNVDAIEEFAEVQERDKFLTEQYEDTRNSRLQLRDIIDRLNKTSLALFKESFEKVRENFKEMFGTLFGGGAADLQLIDAEDPLDSGIDIIARPPGKRLASVSLLSGGERTMTAVALLFAIYMVKPSPFCILDEMDAPLDESNIDRFLKILDRFVHQSQFVVITHNKRTIARADVLYGVTMQERGVSRLVGVRLREAEEMIDEDGEASGDAQVQADDQGRGHAAQLDRTAPHADAEHPPHLPDDSHAPPDKDLAIS